MQTTLSSQLICKVVANNFFYESSTCEHLMIIMLNPSAAIGTFSKLYLRTWWLYQIHQCCLVSNIFPLAIYVEIRILILVVLVWWTKASNSRYGCFSSPIIYLAHFKIMEQAKKVWLHKLQFEDFEFVTYFSCCFSFVHQSLMTYLYVSLLGYVLVLSNNFSLIYLY
jgi:hypothetical protein